MVRPYHISYSRAPGVPHPPALYVTTRIGCSALSVYSLDAKKYSYGANPPLVITP